MLPSRQVHNYTCPYCYTGDLSEMTLREHVIQSHAKDPKPVVCPICAAQPDGDPTYVSRNFPGHLQQRHRTTHMINSIAAASSKGFSISDIFLQFQKQQDTGKGPDTKETTQAGETIAPKHFISKENMGSIHEPEALTKEEISLNLKEQELRSIFVQDILFSSLV